ncbi:MAG: LUD domain-containing protein [Candidatus Micrarchaeota archaeon]
MANYSELAVNEVVEKTIESLKKNGIAAELAANREEAKKRVLELVPEGAEVFTYTSQTLLETGIAKEINESGRFDSVRVKFTKMDKLKQAGEMRKLGAAPDFALGSVHAVTEDGKLLIASASGSQIPAYVYGAGKVIWVVGTQKIVKNPGEGMKRIYEYVLPLENERALKAYGAPSSVNKLLTIFKESGPERLHVIFVNEKLGF